MTDALKNENEDLKSTINSWFDIKSMSKEQLVPVFMDNLRGYLRTSRNGGMPQKQSDLVESVVENFADLYLSSALWPILLRLAEEKRGELKVPVGLAPVNNMTDEKILASITKHLDKTPQMPVNVSDMNDHEREFFKVISYQSGMLLFLQHVFAERVKHA